MSKSFKSTPSYQMNDWHKVEMPLQSHYRGFSPPINITKWKEAIAIAESGEPILLHRALKAIHHQNEISVFDRHAKWLWKIKQNPPLNAKAEYRFYYDGDLENTTYDKIGARSIAENIYANKYVPLKNKTIVLTWSPYSDNYGWGSTFFPNRSINWGTHFKLFKSIHNPEYQIDEIQQFLDDPNLIAIQINQHHNLSHHKVLSVPLGIPIHFEVYTKMKSCSKLKKNYFIISATSEWGARPYIRNCVKEKLGDSLFISKKMLQQRYYIELATSRLVLALPGMGYDTYRLWESLLLGAVPVLERGIGLDRTLHRLPALLVDDFADLNITLLASAYVEAIYRADEWEYKRITIKWYADLFTRMAMDGNSDALQTLHPLYPEDYFFTRPLVPFNCSAGCCKGTKRTPVKSCSIYPNVYRSMYKWSWDWSDRRRLSLEAQHDCSKSILLAKNLLYGPSRNGVGFVENILLLFYGMSLLIAVISVFYGVR